MIIKFVCYAYVIIVSPIILLVENNCKKHKRLFLSIITILWIFSAIGTIYFSIADSANLEKKVAIVDSLTLYIKNIENKFTDINTKLTENNSSKFSNLDLEEIINVLKNDSKANSESLKADFKELERIIEEKDTDPRFDEDKTKVIKEDKNVHLFFTLESTNNNVKNNILLMDTTLKLNMRIVSRNQAKILSFGPFGLSIVTTSWISPDGKKALFEYNPYSKTIDFYITLTEDAEIEILSPDTYKIVKMSTFSSFK
ncbi:MAG: hypothetical protein HQ534_08410 [Armatimonadetes bacterium]|nr:hypothetical protein [Armatimonadota bacterium]